MADRRFEEISDGENDFDELEENGGIRKNLLEEFGENDLDENGNNGRELMKVHLRIRPFTAEEKDSSQNQECMEIEGETAINLKAPKDSFTFKNEKRGRDVEHRFTFTKVFGPETTQKQFFDLTSLDLVKDFMDGQNCLMFTYGVTNSGKTYTIQGTPNDGGILPRTLDVVFNSIQNKQYHRMNLKPRYFCDVVKINEKQEQMERALFNGLLMSLNKENFDLDSFLQLEDSEDFSKESIDDYSTQASLKSEEGELTENEITLDDDMSRVADKTAVSVDAQGPIKFSVWVSFAEIYNELIFDLLEPCPEGKGKKRRTLKIGEDKNGNPYIKGLREVCISSANEAYKILRVGKKNQRISCTRLNQVSSRSHCIFSIKVLRVVDVENPHAARVSRLSFVDLAGSERYTNTQNKGDRLKEAGNINTSLMTLGKCLNYLRYNQLHPNHSQIIPFRESKLTRLFQGFFCGKGKASMIVNINQCTATFDETYHALKFSAIAKQVTTKVTKPSDMLPLVEKSFRPSFAFPVSSKAARMSIPWENGAMCTPAEVRCEPIDEDEKYDENDDEQVEYKKEDIGINSYQKQLENLVRVLQDQLIEEKKSKDVLEIQIRQEVCTEMAEQLVAIESECSARIQEQVNAVEEQCDLRIELLTKSIKKTRKRARIEKREDDEEEWVPTVQLHAERVKVKELKAQVSKLESNIESMNTEIKQEGKIENQELKAQVSKLESNIESMKSEIEQDEKRIENQNEIIMELQVTVETSCKELELYKSKLDKRDQMLREKDATIQELQRKLENNIEKLSLKTECQEDTIDKLEYLGQELRKNKMDIEKLQKNLVVQEKLVEEKSMALEVSEECISQMKQSIEEKSVLLENNDGEIKSLKEKTKAFEEEAKSMAESLLKSDERIQYLQKRLEECETLLEEKSVCLKEQEDLVKKLRNNIKEHEVALENNESFLGQLNNEVRQISYELDTKNQKAKEQEEFCQQGGLETALASKLANLREQLLSRDELMKELVQSLEDTRAQVELDKGDLVMLNNKQKTRILELEEELNILNKVGTGENFDMNIESLKEKLKNAEQDYMNAKEQIETHVFEKEEMQCALHDAHVNEKVLQNQYKKVNQELEDLKKSNSETKVISSSLEKTLVERNEEIERLKAELKKNMELKVSLGNLNMKVTEQERELTVSQSEKEKVVIELKKLKDANASLVEAKSKVLKLEESLLWKELRIKDLIRELEDAKIKKEGNNESNAKIEEELKQGNFEQTDKVQELEKQLEETTRALDKKNSQVISKNNAIKRLELLVSEKDSKLSEMVKDKEQSMQTPSKNLRTKEEIRTLRRRAVQADKETEELKQKMIEYQSKIEEVSKKENEKTKEICQLQDKLEGSKNEIHELETQLNNVKEVSNEANEKLEANEKKLEVYRLQELEYKEKADQAAKLLEEMKEEIERAKDGQEKKIQELADVRLKAELYEKRVEEIQLEHSENVRDNDGKVTSLMEKLRATEEDLKRNGEKLQMLEESKENEGNLQQAIIQAKDKQLERKEEAIKEITHKLTELDREKSEELDKVWNTLVEHQALIKSRGETIDDLESKLRSVEARHSREKETLENTAAKMKEVMETKGGDRKKHLSRIAELESKIDELQKMNNMLNIIIEKSEKDTTELKKVLDEQDAVMEEQERALNERQQEIESLVCENRELKDNLNTKDNSNESTIAEIRRLEGTLGVYVEEKEKLEKEICELRNNDHQTQMSKVEISRDFEKEKNDILVKLKQKEGVIAKLKTQLKSAQSEANTEKKAMLLKVKDLEAEINKLTVKLEVTEGKKQEYEGLCQLKDADVRAANEEKEETLKAMRQAFAIAAAKKDEYQAKLEKFEEECTARLKGEHEKEIQKLKDKKSDHTANEIPDLMVELNKMEVKTRRQSTEILTIDGSPTSETIQKRTDKPSTRLLKSSESECSAAEEKTKLVEPLKKSTEKGSKCTLHTTLSLNTPVEVLMNEQVPEGRIEIDVTPIKLRKRSSRVPSKSTAKKKRRSSELPLSEVKYQLSSRKTRKQTEISEDEFTPGSVKQKERPRRSTRKNKTNSTVQTSAKSQRTPAVPLSPMVKNSAPEELKKQPSVKKKRFLGKLFSNTDGEENTPPPKKGRKLLKKDISAPMDIYSPCIAMSKNKETNKAHSLITRELRSRAIKF